MDLDRAVRERRPRLQAGLTVGFATSEADVRDAQRLRYQVFGEEMGAQLHDARDRLDQDRFDEHCDHLLVRDEVGDSVVGTYRILRPEVAKRIGGYYIETEFELARLEPLRAQLVELGRCCVHSSYRSGAVIGLMFSGVIQFMMRHRYGYLIGCASVGMRDGGDAAVHLYRQLRATHLAPAQWHVDPLCPLSAHRSDLGARVAEVPHLVKTYLAAGAYVCGAPSLDAAFATADLPLLLPMSRLNPRYARRFGGYPGMHWTSSALADG